MRRLTYICPMCGSRISDARAGIHEGMQLYCWRCRRNFSLKDVLPEDLKKTYEEFAKRLREKNPRLKKLAEVMFYAWLRSLPKREVLDKIIEYADKINGAEEAAALVYVAAKEEGYLYPSDYFRLILDGLPWRFHVPVKRVRKKTGIYRYPNLERMEKEIDLLCDSMKVSDCVREKAKDICRFIWENGKRTLFGKKEEGFVCAAVYAAAKQCGDHISQRVISDHSGITEMTIRKRVRDLEKLNIL